jgi:DNA-binding MarR family transcriptional regulator
MEQLDSLLNEVRLLWHVLVQTGERLLADQPVTLALRAVLEFLDRNGPATVPGIARSRRVSRQHIQTIVNDLLGKGLVALRDNPAHRRSAHVELTGPGRQLISGIRRLEARFLSEHAFSVADKDLNRARKVLRSVRRTLEGKGMP